MARKPRVHYEGAIYHVIARGNNRSRVFETDEEKGKYLEILSDYKKRYSFQLYAYVIMDNHVHLLIQIGKDPLAKIMQGIQQRYTQYYNWQHKHSGHVFEQRYKALLCEKESYVMTLICYIHQNPVRANILEGVNYRWSSHPSYVKRARGLVNVEFILDTLSSNPIKAVEKYLDLVGVAVNKPEYNNESVQGKEDQKVFLKEEKEKRRTELTWEQLIENITVEEEVNPEMLLGKCRIRQVVAARKRLIYEVIDRNLMTRTQLAKMLQMDPANITRIWQALMDNQEINAK
ncbi:transposase [Sporomusa malonica]|uniref:REP element-mobilizing transposase RayT n=1 Tax=Sporomusa malonica TaxID=112901 RepID=A0A1W2E3H9_9FIRM|nr:transposase [Sporomusa malonica]SMD03932.1 REP element-mobilizing transposase RayT [Sporomusa malonica]